MSSKKKQAGILSVILVIVLLLIPVIIYILNLAPVDRYAYLKENIADNEKVIYHGKGIMSPQDDILSNEEMTMVMKQKYGFKNMIKHQVYTLDKKIQMDFYFENTATKDEINDAIIFLESNNDRSGNGTGKEPVLYDEIMSRDFYDIQYTRIIIDDTLVFQKALLKNKDEKRYEKKIFEDDSKVYEFREVDEVVLNEFKEKILMESFNISDAKFERSLNFHTLILTVYTEDKFSSQTKVAMKRAVDTILSEHLYTNQGYISYRGVLVKLVYNNKTYFEELYVNSESKEGWANLKENDWMNYPYIEVYKP